MEIVREEAVLKEEELEKYQRHCESLADEVVTLGTFSFLCI